MATASVSHPYIRVSIAFRLLKRLVASLAPSSQRKPLRVSIAFRLLKRLVAQAMAVCATHVGMGLNCLSAVEAIGSGADMFVIDNVICSLNCLSAVEAIGSLPYFRPFG